ncbi:hypothetical protein A2U01_0096242, partial [Trifolium medium]|nr:hypothetical protein [Trifolium medium]
MEVVEKAHESISEYQNQLISPSNPENSATRNRSNNSDNWSPPPRNSLKLNVDAH